MSETVTNIESSPSNDWTPIAVGVARARPIDFDSISVWDAADGGKTLVVTVAARQERLELDAAAAWRLSALLAPSLTLPRCAGDGGGEVAPVAALPHENPEIAR